MCGYVPPQGIQARARALIDNINQILNRSHADLQNLIAPADDHTQYLNTTRHDAVPRLVKLAQVDLGAPATTITINNLDINTYKYFLMFFNILNNSAGAQTVGLYVNNDLTSTNYRMQYLQANATSISANRVNNAEITYMGANTSSSGLVSIMRDVSGYPAYFISTSYTDSTYPNTNVNVRSVVKTATVANITRLDVVHSAANGLGIGTQIILYGGLN